jgi:hypothetical protein
MTEQRTRLQFDLSSSGVILALGRRRAGSPAWRS